MDPINLFGSMNVVDPLQRAESTEEAAKQFEGLMLQLMIKEMRKTLPEGGLFSGSDMEIYQDLLDQAIADNIASGEGLGLAEQIMASLGEEGDGQAESALEKVTRRYTSFLPDGLRDEREPLPVSGRVSSAFGHRSDPLTGQSAHHRGIDIAAPLGSSVRPVRPGVVTFAGDAGSYGKVVYVDHGDGLQTRYAHCSRLLVEAGDSVEPHQAIAEVGNTGRSTGPHLHFEARQDGEAVDPIEIFGW